MKLNCLLCDKRMGCNGSSEVTALPFKCTCYLPDKGQYCYDSISQQVVENRFPPDPSILLAHEFPYLSILEAVVKKTGETIRVIETPPLDSFQLYGVCHHAEEQRQKVFEMLMTDDGVEIASFESKLVCVIPVIKKSAVEVVKTITAPSREAAEDNRKSYEEAYLSGRHGIVMDTHRAIEDAAKRNQQNNDAFLVYKCAHGLEEECPTVFEMLTACPNR